MFEGIDVVVEMVKLLGGDLWYFWYVRFVYSDVVCIGWIDGVDRESQQWKVVDSTGEVIFQLCSFSPGWMVYSDVALYGLVDGERDGVDV